MQIASTEVSLQTDTDIHRSKKFSIIISIVMVCAILASFAYYYFHTVISDGVLSEANTTSYTYQIDSATLANEHLSVSGWCFDPQKNYTQGDSLTEMRIILVDLSDQYHRIYIDAKYGNPESKVNDYFNDGIHNYTYCGFYAECDLKSLNLGNRDYEIYIQPDKWSETTLHSGQFIYQEKILNENPNAHLEVNGTDLEEIVRNGTLRVYRPDIGMYVYQYGWTLYFIAEDDYPIDAGWNIVALNFGTTRAEFLPMDRQESGCECLNFNFIDHEITEDINAGYYRVAKYELTLNYPITWISTGYWSSSWIWRDVFSPGLPLE